MTLIEFMNKLTIIVNKNIKDKNDISKNELYFLLKMNIKHLMLKLII